MPDPKITVTLEDIPKIFQVLDRSQEYARSVMEREIAAAVKKYELTVNAVETERRKLRNTCTHPDPKHSFLEVGPHEYKDYWACMFCDKVSFDSDDWDD